MMYARFGHGICAIDEVLYVMGGFHSGQKLKACEKYNVRDRTWSKIADMNDASCGGSAVTVCVCVFVPPPQWFVR
jgi:hypothetical protein